VAHIADEKRWIASNFNRNSKKSIKEIDIHDHPTGASFNRTFTFEKLSRYDRF
jgi:hypothetical protein